MAKSNEKGTFKPVIGLRQVLGISIAAISPTTSVFLVYGDGLHAAGTGVFWAFIIGACIAISMAFCYAELGSMYPGAGGAYTIIRKSLGKPTGFIAVLLFLLLGIVVTASILVSSATYLNSLVPQIPVNLAAVAMMALITWFSLERIGTASWIAIAMLIIELAVILLFIVISFTNMSHPIRFILQPVNIHSHSVMSGINWSAMMAAVVPALFAFNGYDWPLYFSEETRDPRRVLPKAVMISVFTAVVVEVLAVVSATLAIPDFGTAMKSSAPLTYIIQSAAGNVGASILIIGVIIAMFDTGLSGNLAYARIYLDAARNDSWPSPINKFFKSMNQHNVPKWGFVFLGIGNAFFCYFTSLNSLITFTGVIIVTIYLLIAISAIVSRFRSEANRPFTMPIWPLPPIIAIIGVIIALTQQAAGDIIKTGVVIIAGIIYWLAYLRTKELKKQVSEKSQSDYTL
ncbi:APC family permease [Heyndrickxia acidicola]|uniref:APC family permease n=1 Tax=Heyndrickxia acidicola TaxID=209389 RepID=A0ABU6MQW8_9BACI|nr:APC family permease [Heyndrickxia acidicola]MED1205440.1 APC family permease [Heyndrickxia acidicola]